MDCTHQKVVQLDTPATRKHDLETLFLEWFSLQSKEKGVDKVNGYLAWSDSMKEYYTKHFDEHRHL